MFVIMFGYTSTSVAQPSKRLQIEGIDQRASEQEKQGERWGLFIGIEDYDDPRVTDLRYSIDDVQRITEILRDPARGAFEHLKVLTSDTADTKKRPTRINILRALNGWLAGAKPEDTVLFFFSGHGATDSQNRNYLIPVDAQVDLLEDSAILMERINEILDNRHRIEAKKVIVVLDSCHSGSKVGQKAFTVEGKILDPLFTDTEGRITFASCDRDESSYEYEELAHGVFSYYMAEGLKGDGDKDRDGYIDADELFTYVADSVKSWTKRLGDKQTPRKQMNVTGKILLGYHPEHLARRQQDAAQAAFDTYKKKLRAITDLDVTELTEAEKLLERGMMGQPLTGAEERWVRLIRDLADGKISVEIYRLASPQSTPPPRKGGGRGIFYVIGGAIATAGGIVGALLFGGGGAGDDDDDSDNDDIEQWPEHPMPLPPGGGGPPP